MGSLFGDTPKAPKPLQPKKVAAQQLETNLKSGEQQAAFNRVNQTDQFGNTLNYAQTGKDANGNPIYSATQTGSAQEMGRRNDLWNSGYGGYNQGLARLGAMGLSDDISAPQSTLDMRSGGQMSGNIYAPSISATMGSDARTMYDPEGLLKQGANQVSSLSGQPLPDSSGAFDQAYSYATANLEPRFQRSTDALENKLRNQGLDPTSEAYKSAMNDSALQQNEARNNLVTNLQGQMFNQGLQQRQQGISEGTNLYGLGQGQAQNIYGQNLGQNQFGAQREDSIYGQNLNNANFAANRGDTRFNQGLQNAQYNTDQENALFSQNLNAANFNAGRDDTRFNQGYQNAQGLAQLGLSGMPDPQVQGNYANVPGISTITPDMAALAAQKYQGQMNQYNAQMQNQGSMLGGLASIGSGLLGFL